MASKPHRVALAGLLTGALVWGLIWYPYRVLASWGLSGILATSATYGIAFLLSSLIFRHVWRTLRATPLVLSIALASGGCNLGYVLGMLQGEVMRVLLLFYLSPLWTVPLSRLILKERLHPLGGLVMLVSLVGAVVMLWRPGMGLPWPSGTAEWWGLLSGFLFALTNVLCRRAVHLPEQGKTLVLFAGAVLACAVCVLISPQIVTLQPFHEPAILALVALLGVVLIAVNMAVQYGLSHIRANLAALILLCELLVAAIGAWLLAGETMGPREYLGGTLIIAAAVIAVRLEGDTQH